MIFTLNYFYMCKSSDFYLIDINNFPKIQFFGEMNDIFAFTVKQFCVVLLV